MKPLQGEMKESFDKYFGEETDIQKNFQRTMNQRQVSSMQHSYHTKVQNNNVNHFNTANRIAQVKMLYSRKRNGGTKRTRFKNRRIVGAKVVKGSLVRLHEDYNPALSSFLMYKDYSNIYLCSDIHFFKNEIRKRDGMTTKELMTNFKNECKKLGPDDVLIYLGDIGHRECTPEQNREIQRFLKSCNCNKILVRGNHDTLDKGYYKRCGFMFVEENLIYDNIIFSHYPEDINKYSIEGIKYNIHGHLHGNPEYYYVSPKGHYDVWTPRHNFVRLDKIVNLLRKKDR